MYGEVQWKKVRAQSPSRIAISFSDSFFRLASSAVNKVNAYFESPYFLDLPRIPGSMEVRMHVEKAVLQIFRAFFQQY